MQLAARALYKPILPVRISENCSPPGLLTGARPIEISNWFDQNQVYEIGYQLRALASRTGPPPPTLIVGEERRTEIMIRKLEENH